MLCDACLGMLQFRCNELDVFGKVRRQIISESVAARKRVHQRRSGHHRTSLGLKQSANLGCYICGAIWKRFSRVQQNSVCTWELGAPRKGRTGSTPDDQIDTLTEDDFFTFALLHTTSFGQDFSLQFSFHEDAHPTVRSQTNTFHLARVFSKQTFIYYQARA
jgi:hypothetical protein